MFKKSLAVTTMLLLSATAQAELLELSFVDTLGNAKLSAPDARYINPTSAISFSLSGGLGRKVGVVVKDSNGAVVANATSAHITVSDLLVVEGDNYYGKKISVPKLSEGEYTVSAQLLEFNGTVVASDEFPYIVDTTAPIVTGALAFSVIAYYTGDDKAFSNANFSNIRLSGISDSNGIDKANAVAKTGTSAYLSQPIGIDAATGDAVITGYPYAILPVDQKTYTLGIEVFDLAGNKTLTTKEYYVDNSRPPIGFSHVWNPNTSQWEDYIPGMVVYENPAKFRVKMAKADHINFNGTLKGWYTGYHAQDDDNLYYNFSSNKPASYSYSVFLTKAGVRWNAHQSHLNYTLADSVDLGPESGGNVHYRDQDNEWHPRHYFNTAKDLTVTGVKIFAKARNYEQLGLLSGGSTCVIPANETSCISETNIVFNKDRGTGRGYNAFATHLQSSVNGVYDGRFSIHMYYLLTYWDFNKSIVTSSEFNGKTLDITVLDNDRVSDWRKDMWYTKEFAIRATNNNTGEVIKQLAASKSALTYNQYEARFNLSTLPEGNHTLEILLLDSYNNETVSALESNYLIDNSGPTISITESGLPVPSSILGLEGLMVALSDTSEATLTSLQLQGGPTSSIVNLAWRNGNADEYLLEYPKIFPSLAEGEDYTLTVTAKDAFGNTTSKTVSFNYMPNDLINVGNIQTLAINKALRLPDNTPLTVITSAPLRTEEGEIARGDQQVDITLRSDADYSVVIAGVTIAPGETKSMTINVDAHNGALNIPVYPAEKGVSGKAAFLIGLPFIEGVWCEAGYHVKDDYCLKVLTKTPVSNTCPAGYDLNATLKLCTQSLTKPFIALNN
jgi:hypothetical protein